MSLLLQVDLLTRLMQANVLLGMGLAVLGVALSLLATRVARMIRKSSHVDANDRIIVGLKSFGLILILVALIIIVVK